MIFCYGVNPIHPFEYLAELLEFYLVIQNPSGQPALSFCTDLLLIPLCPQASMAEFRLCARPDPHQLL